MSSQAQPVSTFDAFKLATADGVIDGRADASAFERLRDRLAKSPSSSPIEWRIEGSRDGGNRPQLTIALEGELWLDCQRCLQAFAWPLAHATTVLLARDEAELARLDADELEVVLATARMNALELVEDELVLTVPFAPHHPDGLCPAPPMPATEARAGSPFAGLDKLRK